MRKTVTDIEQDFRRAQEDRNDRFRTLIAASFPGRGMFRKLQDASGISDLRWKNFFYRKQDAAADMLAIWVEIFPGDRKYLEAGRSKPTKLLVAGKADTPASFRGIPKGNGKDQAIAPHVRLLNQKKASMPASDGNLSEAQFSALAKLLRSRGPAKTAARIVLVMRYAPKPRAQSRPTDNEATTLWLASQHGCVSSVIAAEVRPGA